MLTAQFNAATVWPDGNSVESSGTTMKEATQKAFDTICAEYVELEGYTSEEKDVFKNAIFND